MSTIPAADFDLFAFICIIEQIALALFVHIDTDRKKPFFVRSRQKALSAVFVDENAIK